MERLKGDLAKNGWEIVDYGPGNSRNKNLGLTADNDAETFGVYVSYRAKDDPPNLDFFVVSGCRQILDGQEIEQF